MSSLVLVLNEPGGGDLKLPALSPSALQIASGQYIHTKYRGTDRGGFFVEDINTSLVNSDEAGGLFVSVRGRGALALLDDGIVWDDGTKKTTREFLDMTPADTVITLINEAQARGCFPTLSCDFTPTEDSESVSWSTVTEDMEFTVGKSLLDVVREVAELGIDFRMVSNTDGTFVLSAYKNPYGSDKSAAVFFRRGVNCIDVSSTERGGEIKNVLKVKYEGGFSTVSNSASIAARRRREGVYDAINAYNSGHATAAGNARLQFTKNPKVEMSLRVSDLLGPKVFIDYDLGDYVTVDMSGDKSVYRIVSVQCLWGEGIEKADVVVGLNSLTYENEIRQSIDIKRLQDKSRRNHDGELVDVSFWTAFAKECNLTHITAMHVKDNKVYVSGYKGPYPYDVNPIVGGIAHHLVSVFDTDTLKWSTSTPYDTDHALCLESDDNYLYIGGATGVRVSKMDLVTLEVTSFLDINIPGEDDFFTEATSMHRNGNYLYIGGYWTEISSDPIVSPARIDLSDTSAISMSTAGGSYGDRAIFVHSNGKIYANGRVYVAPAYVYFLAEWDESESEWVQVGDALSSAINALCEDDNGNLIMGGHFAEGVLSYDGSAFNQIAGGINGIVHSLSMLNGDIIAAGDFTEAGNPPVTVNNVTRYTGQWVGLGADAAHVGTDDSISHVVVVDENIGVGGVFNHAGGKAADSLAAYISKLPAALDWVDGGGSSGESNIPTSFNASRFIVSDTDRKLTTNAKFYYDKTYGIVYLGGAGGMTGYTPTANLILNLLANADDTQVFQTFHAWGNSANTAGGLIFFASGGTKAAKTAVLAERVLAYILGYAHDGVAYSASSVARMYFAATENHSATNHGTGIYFDGVPTGSTTREMFAEFLENGINIGADKTYNIDGAPHTHDSGAFVPPPILTEDPATPEDGEQWYLRTSTPAEFADGDAMGMMAFTYFGDTETIAPMRLSFWDDAIGEIVRLN